MPRSLLVVCASLLTACSSGETAGLQESSTDPTDPSSERREARAPKDAWTFVQALAALHESGPLRPASGVAAVIADLPEPTPAAVRDAIAARVVLVPYAGSFVDPRSVRAGAKLNTLDRALYLRSALEAAGHPARVVFADRGGDVKVHYPVRGPRGTTAVPRELRLALERDVEALVGPLWTAVREYAPRWIAQGGGEPEREVFWVQVQESGRWSNLLFADTKVGNEGSAAARPLTEASLAERTWRVTIAAEVRRGPNSRDVLTHESPAAALHAQAVTYFHRPEGSLASLTPVLLVGDQVHEGAIIEDGGEAGRVDEIRLRVELAGPGPPRVFARRLVAPRDEGTSDEERGLELAALARLTVVTTRLSDLDHAAIVEGVFAQIARALFEGGVGAGNAPPLNLASLRAVALLGAAERLSATISAEAIVYRARPALVLERETVVGRQGSLHHVESMDVLEPGTSVYGPGAADEEIGRAALASSIVEARLEDWLAVGEGVVTSFERVERGVRAGEAFSTTGPSEQEGADRFGDGGPTFVTIGGREGPLAGLRLARGPQVVFVLGDRSGGARSERPIDRVRSLCEPLQWGSVLVPLRVMPYSWLVGPIVAYNCRLAEAYNRAGSVLDNLFGENPPSEADERIRDLERQIEGLGPDLLADLATWAAINGAVHGLVVPVAERFANDVIAPVLSYVNEAGARLIPRASGGGSRISADEAGRSTTRVAARRAADAAARMRAEGMAAEEAAAVVRNSTREGAEAAAERVAAGESTEVVLLEGGSAAEAAAGRRLKTALDRWYQREGVPFDRIHQTSVKELRMVGRTGVLRNPMAGQTSANFSGGGAVGTIRQGGGAIRVRGGELNPRIDFVDVPGAGSFPRYWRDGVGVGRPLYDIPTSELEYFNVVGGEWVPFPPVGG